MKSFQISAVFTAGWNRRIARNRNVEKTHNRNNCCVLSVSADLNEKKIVILSSPLLSAAPNTKDLDVYIKRNQESGFGFRVLGGEGPDQPVGSSPARSGPAVYNEV